MLQKDSSSVRNHIHLSKMNAALSYNYVKPDIKTYFSSDTLTPSR